MYTQEDADVTNPADFARDWIIASKARLPGVQFSHQPRPTSKPTTSRNYMYLRYGVPAVTYEVGDRENRSSIRQTAGIFAEEFMRMFLETPQP